MGTRAIVIVMLTALLHVLEKPKWLPPLWMLKTGSFPRTPMVNQWLKTLKRRMHKRESSSVASTNSWRHYKTIHPCGVRMILEGFMTLSNMLYKTQTTSLLKVNCQLKPSFLLWITSCFDHSRLQSWLTSGFVQSITDRSWSFEDGWCQTSCGSGTSYKLWTVPDVF